jgi:hypothetical protein
MRKVQKDYGDSVIKTVGIITIKFERAKENVLSYQILEFW